MCIRKLLNNKTSKLSYKLYVQQKEEQGHQLEDWLRAEKIVIRKYFGYAYITMGAILLFLFASTFTCQCLWRYLSDKSIVQIVLWILGFTSLGIGSGLVNTRDHDYENWFLQHVCYCGFVLLCISLISFTISIYWSGAPLRNPDIKFFALSAVVSVVGGFLVDVFHPSAQRF